MLCAPAVTAQWQSASGPGAAAIGVPVGSEVERYLHALTLTGLVGDVPWAVRPFGAADVDGLLRRTSNTSHPWGAPMQARSASRARLGASVTSSVNSNFAWGANDGPQWQGRGVNAAFGVAAAVRLGHVTATVAPLVWMAQNASFALMPTVGPSQLLDPLFPFNTDRPQRFGRKALARWHPGESNITIAGAGIAAGISTSASGWGVMEAFPAILGPNAGGFPHLFAGTRPTGLRIPALGRVTAKYIFGTMTQSEWSTVAEADTFATYVDAGRRRVAVGVTASFMPAAVPSLEIGASRFYHSGFLPGSAFWKPWTKPLEGFSKRAFGDRSPGTADPTGDADNQLASIFARWTLPKRGAEFSFELMRDDHSWDSRDLAQEPEQNSAVAASARILTHRRAGRLAVLTFEYFDGDVRPIAQQRANGLLYQHHIFRQGHTLDGQLLGAPLGVGAVRGAAVSWERFTPERGLRVSLQRTQPRSRLSTDPEYFFRPATVSDPLAHDVVYDASVSLSRYGNRSTRGLQAGVVYAPIWYFSSPRGNMYVRGDWSIF